MSRKTAVADIRPSYSIVWKSRMADIDRSSWNALALPLETPLLEWDWLRLLEDSGSVCAETGWQPVHLTVWSGERLVGAAPLYAKSHSNGEFVFDHAWAHLAQRLGIRYYPKLVGMSPFSPVVGYRFLIDTGQDTDQITRLMVTAIDQFCHRNAIMGCSFLFIDPEWQSQMEALGFSAWRHQSYAWRNRGFGSFEDYLAIFNSNQRRNIRRERRSTVGAGIVIRPLTGVGITPEILELMYTYYRRTNARFGPWGCKYLTKAFFEGLNDRFRDHLLLMAAFDGSHNAVPIALSFLLTKRDRLYGRYWGSAAEFNHLHFDTCYYSPIDWAINHQISVFDPGAGSPHKIRRGFEAVANHSLHRFYDPGLDRILRSHIGEINRQEQLIIDDLNAALPFSKAFGK